MTTVSSSKQSLCAQDGSTAVLSKKLLILLCYIALYNYFLVRLSLKRTAAGRDELTAGLCMEQCSAARGCHALCPVSFFHMLDCPEVVAGSAPPLCARRGVSDRQAQAVTNYHTAAHT